MFIIHSNNILVRPAGRNYLSVVFHLGGLCAGIAGGDRPTIVNLPGRNDFAELGNNSSRYSDFDVARAISRLSNG